MDKQIDTSSRKADGNEPGEAGLPLSPQSNPANGKITPRSSVRIIRSPVPPMSETARALSQAENNPNPPPPAPARPPQPEPPTLTTITELQGSMDENGRSKRPVRRGRRPGDRYLRISPASASDGSGSASVAEVINWEDQLPVSLWRRFKTFLIGTPLTTAHAAHERLGKLQALAVLSSDALSSVAYATEAALFVLVIGFTRQNPEEWIIPISVAISLLIAIVAWSYRQTIHAYPNGGGSYIVAKDNLGVTAGLLAAGALMIEYVLTVAVSIASGVSQLTSALPSLAPYDIWISMGLVLLLMLGNLRGIRESGAIFALPTYFFIVSFLILIAVGLFQLLSPGHPIITFTLPDG